MLTTRFVFKILASPASLYVLSESLPLIKSATKAPHEDWGPAVPKASPPSLLLPLRDLKTLRRQCGEGWGREQVRFTPHTKNCQNYHKLLGHSKKISKGLSHSHKLILNEGFGCLLRNACQLVGKTGVKSSIFLPQSMYHCAAFAFSRAGNLMSPLVISSTRNGMTSTTQRLQTGHLSQL